MKMINLGTLLASVLLSIAASLLITNHQKLAQSTSTPTPTLIRTRAIELTDEQGKVRATISTVKIEGHEQPQIALLDQDGHSSVLLSVNRRGEGTVYFSSPDREGRVALGYVWGSDAQAATGQDPLGLWGMRVLGRNGQVEALGIGNDGKPVLPVK
jgi:hypothetical protein